MARPEEQSLILARGTPAPQIWDDKQGKYVVATGDNGTQYVEDVKQNEAVKGIADTLKKPLKADSTTKYFDTKTRKEELLQGIDGAIFVEDKMGNSFLNNIAIAVERFRKDVVEDSLIFIKKADAMPPVKNGMMVYVIDTSEVYVPYKGKWELLV